MSHILVHYIKSRALIGLMGPILYSSGFGKELNMKAAFSDGGFYLDDLTEMEFDPDYKTAEFESI